MNDMVTVPELNTEPVLKKKGLFIPREYYKPFEYPQAFDFYQAHESMHWLPKEIALYQDVHDWKNKLSETEKYFLTQIFRLFTQSDVDVAGAYVSAFMPLFPKPEIRMMLLSFAAREAIHIQAYSHLIDTLGMPETTYKQFNNYQAMKDKHQYIDQLIDSSNGDQIPYLLEQIAVFSAFTEGMQLFSSFIMLLNFTRFNKMNGMGQMIAWSIKDETCLHEDTEVLTLQGWKYLRDIDINQDKVMQYDIESKELEYVFPDDLVCTTVTESYIFESDNYHQHVTADHRMICAEGVYRAEEATESYSYIVSGKKTTGCAIMSTDTLKLVLSIIDGNKPVRALYNLMSRIASPLAKEMALFYCYMQRHDLIDNNNDDVETLFHTLANIGNGYIDKNTWTFIENEISKVSINKVTHDSQTFYCLKVPSKAFLIKSDGKISVTGNCHVEGMTWLAREVIKENRSIWNDSLKSKLYSIAEKMVELENNFIDLAFDTGGIEGLDASDVKKYIKYITDRRLIALGLKGIFKVKKNPLPWVEEIINAPEHTSFFELKGTTYSKASTTGSWENVWS